MKLIDDASEVWHRLWSVRLSLLAALLGAISAAMPYVAPAQPSLRYAVASVLLALAAAASRVIAQPKLQLEKPDGIL